VDLKNAMMRTQSVGMDALATAPLSMATHAKDQYTLSRLVRSLVEMVLYSKSLRNAMMGTKSLRMAVPLIVKLKKAFPVRELENLSVFLSVEMV
jgi:hypothetical protein